MLMIVPPPRAPDFEEHLARVPDRAEIEKQIAEIDEKIGGLESDRDHLKHYLARSEADRRGTTDAQTAELLENLRLGKSDRGAPRSADELP